MLNWFPLLFAVIMATFDGVVMSGIKAYHTGQLTWKWMMPAAMLAYSLQPLFFLQSLKFESMTVMNLLWDVLSDLMVTGIGLFYFRERLTRLKRWGLFFAFIAIVLLSYDTVENNQS